MLQCSNQSPYGALGFTDIHCRCNKEMRVRKLGQTIATMARYRRHWSTLLQTTGAHRATAEPRASSDHLTELTGFGSNPGALRMFTHAPKNLGPSPALVVVLHGCTQSAGSYDLGAGWSTLADRYGFVLLLPEQTPANNPKTLLQLVPARRHHARSGRGAVDPPDDREDDRRARHRPRPRVHHRALGRRRDGGGDARHLPGSVLGRRDHRGSALRRGRKRAAGLREHVPGPAAHRAGVGRSGAARFEASRAVAARLGVARRRRRDRGADERRRPHPAMDRRARHRGGAGRRPGSTAMRARSGAATASTSSSPTPSTAWRTARRSRPAPRRKVAARPGRSCSRPESRRPTTSRSSSA